MPNEYNLNNCSKEDLLWIINYLSLVCGPCYVNQAINELSLKKETARISKASEYAAVAHQKRMEFLSLIKPYDGQQYHSIPSEIMQKAEQALKEADAAEIKYNKLTRRRR